MNRICLLIAVILVSVSVRATTAKAGCLTRTQNWVDTTQRVIYLHHDPLMPNTGFVWGVGLPLADVENGIKRTISILNEESGSGTKLTYGGIRKSSVAPAGSILLTGLQCSDGQGGRALSAGGQVFWNITTVGALQYINSVRLVAYRQSGSIINNPEPTPDQLACSNNTLTFDEGDFYELMLHELGHAVYRMDHPNEDPIACPDWTLFHTSVMLAQFQTPRTLVLKDYDLQHFQENTSVRGKYGVPMFSFMAGAATWQTPSGVSPASVVAGVHGSWGSIPTGPGIVRMLPYVRRPDTAAAVNGAGTAAVGVYSSSLYSYTSYGAGNAAMLRPQAIARVPNTNNLLWAYVARRFSSAHPTAEVGKVCFRSSTNAGASFSAEVCPSGAAYYVNRGGITAAYDPKSNNFILGFIGSSDTDTSNYDFQGPESRLVRLMTVPAPGSAAAVQVYATGAKSYHAPSVACRASGYTTDRNCTILFERIDVPATNTNDNTPDGIIAGCARYRHFYFTSGSAPSLDIAAFDTGADCIEIFAQPSIVYDPMTSDLYLSRTVLGQEIGVYMKPPNASFWGQTSTIWNNANEIVSPAALGYFDSSSGLRLEAWFSHVDR